MKLRKALSSLGLYGSIIFISACTAVGPNYVRPQTDEAKDYREAPALNESTLKGVELKADWWLVFNDQKLNSLMVEIENSNYTFQASKAKLEQAMAAASIARSEQYPAVDAGGTNDFGVLASWEVDLWGRIKRNIEASNADIQAGTADLAAVKLSLQAQLAQNYFLLRIQDAEIGLLQDTISSYDKSLEIARNQYAAGIVDRVIVEQSIAQLNATQAQLYTARITRSKLEHSVATLIGKRPADFSIDVEPFNMKLPNIPVVLPSELLQRRPDIAVAERKMAASSARIGVAEASTYPSLNLSVGLSVRKVLIGGEKLFAPLYAGGKLKAVNKKAIAEYEMTVANYRQTILDAFREVEDNLVTLRILKKASTSQKIAVESSRKVVDIIKNQYQAGIVTYQSIIIAQATALTDERSELAILSDQLASSVLLIKAMGGGWEPSVLESAKLIQ